MNRNKYKNSKIFFNKVIKKIPLATQTYSKSYVNFSLNSSPLFLDRGKGAYVWDIDGNKYLDFIIGLLPNILGYNDPDVNKSITNQLKKGISFSLATKLEFELADILTKLLPSAEMVRFAKNGSDVTSAAIRLSRAYTRRDRVLICGYHGWHDWYIGTTEMGLGVPKSTSRLTTSIKFNDYENLKKLIQKNPNSYAALIIEPEGIEIQKELFLKKVRRITENYGIILVFDEIVSGFRINLGGAQKQYNVIPDLTTLGKAMANGMPLAAIVGKKKLMKLMDNIFFSSTYAGETLSIAASISTIKKLQDQDVVKKLIDLGKFLKNEINEAITNEKLNEYLIIDGPNWRPFFKIIENDQVSKTNLIYFLRQEFLDKGILFGSAFNLCLPHTSQRVKKIIMTNILEILSKISKSIKSGKLNNKKENNFFSVR